MATNLSAKNKRRSTPKDLYISKKLRERRIELRLNQSDLANKLGITYQQIYKYEKGLDRIPASRLDDFAKILGVPISFFYIEDREKSPPLSIKDLAFTCLNLRERKVKLKSLKIKAILTDIQTQEDYDVEISGD